MRSLQWTWTLSRQYKGEVVSEDVQAPPSTSRFRTFVHRFYGRKPWILLVFVAPTLLATACDLILRARPIAQMRAYEYGNYLGSSTIGSGIWVGVLWGLSVLPHLEGRRARLVGRVLFALGFALVVYPILLLAYGGQYLYYSVFRSYMARDTLRVGLALRGTAGAWLAEWSWRIIPLALFATVACAVLAWGVWRTGQEVRRVWPVLPIAAFTASTILFWYDQVETRALQAASPDTCLLHSLMGLVRDGAIRGKGAVGVTVRQPRPVPELVPTRRRNVLLIVTESVRGDVLCSARGEANTTKSKCTARFFDEAIPERLGFIKATVQSPSTFSSCMMLWTGLPPEADMRTCHETPFLWEVAKAAGYKTLYVTSQNLRYQDFGAYVKISGAEQMIAGVDLGGVAHPHLGAPDELATTKLVEVIRTWQAPYFAVLHLSNTHWPYRTSPDLEPYSPHSDKPPTKTIEPYWNQYRNSVLFQERTVSELFKALKALPSWENTVALFVSDHGEQFWEHGQLYHIHSLHEEEVRVPAFLVAGREALSDQERSALEANSARRVYSQDLHATMLDALGVLEQRGRLPYAHMLAGRSALRSFGPQEPIVTMSTTTGVWPDHDPVSGTMSGERKLYSVDGSPWRCYLLQEDPSETRAHPGDSCPDLLKVARDRYPGIN